MRKEENTISQVAMIVKRSQERQIVLVHLSDVGHVSLPVIVVDTGFQGVRSHRQNAGGLEAIHIGIGIGLH